jgi:hypothetical protein
LRRAIFAIPSAPSSIAPQQREDWVKDFHRSAIQDALHELLGRFMRGKKSVDEAMDACLNDPAIRDIIRGALMAV